MIARRFTIPGIRRIEIEEFKIEETPDDGILIENEFTAVSIGTEIYNWTMGSEPGGKPIFPKATGYCNVGRVLEVGAAVEGVSIGDRIAGQGMHASHNILRVASGFVRVPDEVESKSAAFMIMAAIALRGVRVARIQLGETVVVFGLGLVGQLCALISRVSGGVPVIGVDIDDFRVSTAAQNSCDLAINPDQVDDLRADISEICPDDGANVILECTGKPMVYPLATSLACLGGRLVAVGSPRGTVEMDFFPDIHCREVSIFGAHQGRTPKKDHLHYRFHRERERQLVMELMASGRLPISNLITHEFEPNDCQRVYTMLADNPQKVLGVIFSWQ